MRSVLPNWAKNNASAPTAPPRMAPKGNPIIRMSASISIPIHDPPKYVSCMNENYHEAWIMSKMDPGQLSMNLNRSVRESLQLLNFTLPVDDATENQ